MWSVFLSDVGQMHALGAALGRRAPAGLVVALIGDLGAGKTALAKGVGEGLGVQEPVVSPTFSLMVEYPDGRLPLLHADLYRLEHAGELREIGLEAAVEGWPGLLLIEWADRFPHLLLPTDHLSIALDFVPEDPLARRARILAHGPLSQTTLRHLQEEDIDG